MATRKIDQNTGFIQFSRSEEDKLLISLKEARGIIESGYIAGSGFYQKFGDGSMEVWGKKVIAGAFNTGNDVSFTIGFMDGFIEPPLVIPVASAYHGSSSFNGFRVSAHLNGINTGNFFGHVHIDFAESVIGSIDVNYMIKGRWRTGFISE